MQYLEQKTERIDIRTTAAAKAILQQAATSAHKTVSEFLLDIGLRTATESLADRKIFPLNKEQWDLFQKTLDRPIKDNSKLLRLINEKTIFE